MATPSTIEPGVVMPETGLSREAVLALSERLGEPGWLREARLEGWEAFESLPLPRWTKGIAQWWTTDVSEIDLDRLRAWVPSSMSPEQARDSVSLAYVSEEDVETGEVTEVAEERGAMLVQVNSEAAYTFVPQEMRAQGVIFSSLEEAVREHPDLVQKYLHKLVKPNTDKFAALHSALWTGGVFLYVP